jgi:hypothetical protein
MLWVTDLVSSAERPQIVWKFGRDKLIETAIKFFHHNCLVPVIQ